MAEELSRQLEDILSTYCRESISDDASDLANGQSHSPELNGLTNEREDDKPEESKVNGGDSGVGKQQKKTHEKKKVKGLGKRGKCVQCFGQIYRNKWEKLVWARCTSGKSVSNLLKMQIYDCTQNHFVSVITSIVQKCKSGDVKRVDFVYLFNNGIAFQVKEKQTQHDLKYSL